MKRLTIIFLIITVFLCFDKKGFTQSKLNYKEEVVSASYSDSSGEILYNGILLPKKWPPSTVDKSRAPIDIPYLKTIPKVIPIDIGRQLFVDDFLIEKTTLKRRYYLAEKFKRNPILRP